MSDVTMFDLAPADETAEGPAPDWLAPFDSGERFVLDALADDTAAARARLAGDIDFESMVLFALRHEVVGELAAFCRRAGLSLPEPLRDSMAVHTERLCRQRDKVRRETLRLAGELATAGLAVVFAKGAIADTLYREDGEVRSAKDLDLYIRLDDLPAVLAALPVDYVPFDAETARMTPAELARRQHHLSVWAEGEGVAVEIHFDLADPRHGIAFDLAGAIERRHTVLLAEGPIATFAPGDAIAFWSAELAKDSWACGKKILDFARSVEAGGEGALREAFHLALAAGTVRMLRVALILAEALSLLRLSPDAAALASGDRAAERIAAICLRRLALEGAPVGLVQRIAEGFAFAGKHDRRLDRLRHVFNIMVLYRLQRLGA